MRIGRIIAIGAGGALAVVGVRKLQQARAGRRERDRDSDHTSTLGRVTPQRPLEPEADQPLGHEQDDAEGVLRPVPDSA